MNIAKRLNEQIDKLVCQIQEALNNLEEIEAEIECANQLLPNKE